MVDKIDSNLTGLAFAEEVAGAPKTLAGSPVFYELEPNSYGDFGGDYKRMSRKPIRADRQRVKGSVIDVDAVAKYNTDVAKGNLVRQLQAFLFANAHERATTTPLNGTAYAPTAVAAGTGVYTGASGFGTTAGFAVGHLVKAVGYTNPANNGLMGKVTAVALTTVTIAGATGTVAEASPPAAAKLEAVGFSFAASDIVATLTSQYWVLTTSANDFTLAKFGFTVGEWVFIGSDTGANNLGTMIGFARLAAFDATHLYFDKTTFTAAANTGTGIITEIYFGRVVKNESAAANIVQKSHQLQRSLGNDGVGIQSELVQGAFAEEIVFTSPLTDKFHCDFNYMALNHTTRTGTQGLLSATGSLVAASGEDAYNTSRDIYRIRIAPVNNTINPTATFGYVSDYSLNIKNNVQVTKAQGTFGGFSASIGGFDVTGKINAYFTSVAAITSVRSNTDFTFDAIYAYENTAFVIDVPLISLATAKLQIAADKPVMLPVDNEASVSALGYTLAISYFPWVPTVGMPV